MKAVIIFGGTGPVLILTRYESFKDEKFVARLAAFVCGALKVKGPFGNR